MGQNNKNSLTQGNISKQLFLFAMPLLLGNMLQQVYFIADSIIVGQLIGDTALAAVGAASAITILMVNFFMGMANGAGIVLAQYVGAGNSDKLGKTIKAASIFTASFGIVCSVLGAVFTTQFLIWMDTPADVFPQAEKYLMFCFIGMLPMLVYNMGASSMQAMGDSKTPLYFLGLASVLNVILDIVFIKVVGMGVEGTAVATCIAQLVAAVLVCRVMFVRVQSVCDSVEKKRVNGENTGENIFEEDRNDDSLVPLFKKIMVLGMPIGIQSIVINFSNIVVQSHINGLGSHVMAAWSAFCRLDGFIILPFMSFGLAVMTFTGQNFGAKKPDRIMGGVRCGMLMSCIFTVAVGVVMIIFAEPCFSIFTKSDTVIAYACNMVYYMVPFYFMLAAARIYIGVISGAGNSITPMVINILFMCVFRVIFLPLAADIFGKNMMVVYYTYWLSWILSLISIMGYYYFKMKKQIIAACGM